MSGNLIALCVCFLILIVAMFLFWVKLNIGNKKNKEFEWENMDAVFKDDDHVSQVLNFNRQEKIKQENLILQAIFNITFGQGDKVAEKAKIKAKLIIAESKGCDKEYLLELLKECKSIDAEKVNETLVELEKMENYRVSIQSLA